MVVYVILYCFLILIATVFATLVDRKTRWTEHFIICIFATPYYVFLFTIAKLLRIKALVSLLEILQSLLCFVFLIVNIVLFFSFNNILADFYSDRMQRLNYADADGQKIVTYLTKEDAYNKDYLPEELQADSVKEVGYVLEITKSSRTQSYAVSSNYSSRRDVHAEVLDVKLIDCDTNRTVASKRFEREFPFSTKDSYLSVSESTVMEWVASVYPE